MKTFAKIVLAAIVALCVLALAAVLTSKSARAAEKSCPDVYTLKVNVWKNKALSFPEVAQTYALESRTDNFTSKGRHVSREHGAQFRKSGEWSAKLHRIKVSLIMTPEAAGGSPSISKEFVVREVHVVGILPIVFDRSDLQSWDAIRLVPLDVDTIESPPIYRETGVREIRFFNHLPGTVLGEWDNNPVPDCIMNTHFIEK